jgi:uncharacterized protein YbgA (DUF1722 family)/uncharacterized protein YbbK (DUF523 family)
LLGDPVRFDGGHKRGTFVTDVLAPYVEWVPVCPEVEAGLGVPREPIRLIAGVASPRVVAIETQTDHTQRMERFSRRRVNALEALDLSGYVFKKDSPSCGMERVRLYNARGMPARSGVGVFARAFMAHFPLVPVEEEGRLNDAAIRENFIERLFCYRRWQDVLAARLTRGALLEFHTRHKLLMLAHSREHHRALGRLAAGVGAHSLGEFTRRYGLAFMNGLKVKSTVRKQVDVLHHIVGYFKRLLEPDPKRELLGLIEDYRRGLVPLIVPLTLIKHYVQVFDVAYVREQVYLNPHPKELMLRNHV